MGIGGIYKSIAYSYSWNQYLFWYIEQKNIQKIQWVLQSKPEVIDQPLTANYKTTPLHRAAVNGSLEICKLLVEKYKADVNVLTENVESALMGAAKRDHVEVVRYLLTMGADTTKVSGVGLLPVQYAILGGFYETSLTIYQRMKDKTLKNFLDYEQLGKQFFYRYVNYHIFVDSLTKQLDPDNVPNFLLKEKKKYEDPVIDPRQTWKEWFKRQMDFNDPPLCERSELPEEMQPQNRLFGKMHHYFSKLSMTSRVQKPGLYPKAALSEVDSHQKFHQKQEAMSEHVEMKSMNE